MAGPRIVRTSLSLDARYPSERAAIALLRAVPARGERAMFLRSVVLIGHRHLREDRQFQRKDGEGV